MVDTELLQDAARREYAQAIKAKNASAISSASASVGDKK